MQEFSITSPSAAYPFRDHQDRGEALGLCWVKHFGVVISKEKSLLLNRLILAPCHVMTRLLI
jgi:hypothetical protein